MANCDPYHRAGLAGLSAAVRLAERAGGRWPFTRPRASGGRCRSYYDAGFGAVIDNGNHLLLSGNDAAMRYLALIGGADKLQGPGRAEFAFADLGNGEHWTLSIDEGLWPAWLFDPARRVPGTTPADYLGALPLMWAGSRKTVTDVIRGDGALYKRLWEPLFLAALNTDPREGSAKLAGAVMRKTLAKGGAACHPLVAEGLSAAFIEPGAGLYRSARRQRCIRRLRAIDFAQGRAAALDFGDGKIAVEEGDTVILAVPPWVAQTLVPGLDAPDEFRSIVNAHFRMELPASIPAIQGVIGGTVEWIFAFPGRISITISGADRLIGMPREELAAKLWSEIAGVTGLPPICHPGRS